MIAASKAPLTLVVIVFLQTWRAAIIPIVAIPVSLIGCFLMMSGLGLTFNTLSLFGLVLAIGIVVDDAIVVREHNPDLAPTPSPKSPSENPFLENLGFSLL
jgi:multidrug efflux pump subunit AcrB